MRKVRCYFRQLQAQVLMHMIYEALGVPMVAFGIGNANSRDHGGDGNVSLADYYTHIELIKELIANYE